MRFGFRIAPFSVKPRVGLLLLMLAGTFPFGAYAQTVQFPSSLKDSTGIEKCEKFGWMGKASHGRVSLHKHNGMAWLILRHTITSGDSRGLKFRNRQTPFLRVEIRVDADGTIGMLNGSIYLTETWSVSQNKYVTYWLQNFSFGDLELSNTPISMLARSEYGNFKNHKTRLGIGGGVAPEKIYEKLTSGATFKSKAVNKNAPSELIEIEIDMSDVPEVLVRLQDMLTALKKQAEAGQCTPL